jgi:hypothetical protein
MSDIEQAKQSLHGHLVNSPWYVAASWGHRNGARILLVFVEESPPANALPEEWLGWPVLAYRPNGQ